MREVAVSWALEHRRWFSDDQFDLFVWFDADGGISWFELCYDRSDIERALTWTPARGYAHWRVSTGDGAGMNYDMTPILVPDDTEFPKDRIIGTFTAAANTLEPTIRSFVIQRLQALPADLSAIGAHLTIRRRPWPSARSSPAGGTTTNHQPGAPR